MKAQRVWAIARKEFIHVARDPRSLGMAIAIPMLMLLMFGYALTLDVDNVPLAVWDRSGSQASRDFISRFTASRYFSMQERARNYAEIERAIDTRAALVALVIPEDFADRVTSGRETPVQIIVDGSDANTAAIALGYAKAVVLIHSESIALAEIRRIGGQSIRAPLDLRPRVWFNEELESRNFIVPGLIAVIMMIIAALLTSLTVAREWERGTMEQLVSTPVTAAELILGKLTPYFVVGMFDVLIAVLMGQFLFHVPLRGNVALLFIMTAIFVTGTLSLGMLVSIITRNQLLANQLAMVLTFLPAFLLSGFMFSIASMPRVIQFITLLVPARYFVALLKGIYLKGVGLEVLAGQAALLVGFSAVVMVVAVRMFKKKVA